MNVNLEILKLNHTLKWLDLIGKQLKIQEMTNDRGVNQALINDLLEKSKNK